MMERHGRAEPGSNKHRGFIWGDGESRSRDHREAAAKHVEQEMLKRVLVSILHARMFYCTIGSLRASEAVKYDRM
jgi:hypothetical protein